SARYSTTPASPVWVVPGLPCGFTLGMRTRSCNNRASCSSFMPVPLHETGDAVFDADLRIVAQQPAGFGNVREGDRHVAGLRRQEVDLRCLAGGFLDEADQFAQLDAPCFAEVDDLETEVAVERREHALQDVVDVGVVA